METHGSRPARVLVVDGEPIVRAGLRAILSDGVAVVEADAVTLEQALNEALRLDPDLVITELALGGGSGIELVRELRSRGARARCVVYAAQADVEDYYQAVLAGVDGFVRKCQPLSELLAAIDLVTRGEQALGQEMLDRLHAQKANGEPARTTMLADLSERERSVLHFIGRGLTNREIASELVVAEKTIRNNVSSVLAKLGMRNRTQVAVYVSALTRQASRGRRESSPQQSILGASSIPPPGGSTRERDRHVA